MWITHDARSTISVIIVTGACGIAAGTPLAVLGAIGRAARQGAIVKGGIHLETLARVDTVVFDKTGTVTFGAPRVIEVRPAEGISERALLSAAASAELRSEHPVARAVLKHAAQMQAEVIPPDSFSSEPGLGVVAEVQGEQVIAGNAAFLSHHGMTGGAASGITIARSGRILGSMLIEDTVRPEAKAALDALRELGLALVLLSGDSQAIVSQLARELGIEEARGDLLPEAKRQRVEALMAQKRTVAMVGDGINDAPALAQASVGIAMGTGTDVAIESADVVLIGGDLRKLVATLRVARACRRIILQNFVGTLVVDGLGVAAASFGLLNPLLAAFIHVGSELAFILNSTRLLPREAADGQPGMGTLREWHERGSSPRWLEWKVSPAKEHS